MRLFCELKEGAVFNVNDCTYRKDRFGRGRILNADVDDAGCMFPTFDRYQLCEPIESGRLIVWDTKEV